MCEAVWKMQMIKSKHLEVTINEKAVELLKTCFEFQETHGQDGFMAIVDLEK